MTRAMTAHCWLQLPLSFIGPLHSCSHTDGEIQGRVEQHGSAPPPADTQTRSSMISSQGDWTHSNKHRRRLLSESNYLPLSISVAAGGQRALCGRASQHVNRRLDILGLFHGCRHSICHPHIPADLITLNKPRRERGRKSQTLMALALCVNPLLSACSLC